MKTGIGELKQTTTAACDQMNGGNLPLVLTIKLRFVCCCGRKTCICCTKRGFVKKDIAVSGQFCPEVIPEVINPYKKIPV